jgi:hypothetical protein
LLIDRCPPVYSFVRNPVVHSGAESPRIILLEAKLDALVVAAGIYLIESRKQLGEELSAVFCAKVSAGKYGRPEDLWQSLERLNFVNGRGCNWGGRLLSDLIQTIFLDKTRWSVDSDLHNKDYVPVPVFVLATACVSPIAPLTVFQKTDRLSQRLTGSYTALAGLKTQRTSTSVRSTWARFTSPPACSRETLRCSATCMPPG